MFQISFDGKAPVSLCGTGGARVQDLCSPALTRAQARPAARKESRAATNRLNWQLLVEIKWLIVPDSCCMLLLVVHEISIDSPG